ncbi:MAG: OmpA family protein [Marinilabiliaceae bacterium]
MRSFLATIMLMLVAGLPLASQENFPIDPDPLIKEASNEEEQQEALKKLDEAEKHYAKGYYEGSYQAYQDLYEITDDVPSLNYKLGISALYGNKAREAAQFLLESVPSVADDYHLQLGYAFQAAFEYSRAKEAFGKYFNSLSGLKKKHFRPHYIQLMKECDFGDAHANDSVPAFVKNPGPVVNTYYDDYGAVENSRHHRIFYTTRRPKKLPEELGGRNEFEERVFSASFKDDEFSEGEEVANLNAPPHSAVAGIAPDEDILFIYHGRKRNGQVRGADITRREVEKPKRVDQRIDKKIFCETAMTETSSGEVFFISDREGGEGGKDIWTARHKGGNRFTKPVNLGPGINSPHDEEAVHATSDGQTLYFASNGHPGYGGYDIYKVKREKNGDWGVPENMGQPVNSPQDDLFYFPTSDPHVAFISSSRPGGQGGLDIYKIQDDLRIPFTITGTVTGEENDEPLYARVALIDEQQNEEVQSLYTDSASGEYSIAVEDTSHYGLHVIAEEYKMETSDPGWPDERNAVVTRDFELEKLMHPYKLYGMVYDQESREPIAAEILFRPSGTDSVAHRVFSDTEEGSYSITFADKKDFDMTIRAQDYYSHEEELLLSRTEGDEEEKNIGLEKSTTEYTLTGRVAEEETDDPVPAEIAVFGASEDDAAEVIYADSISGKYSITVDDPGPFLVEMNADGYFFTNFSLKFHPDTTLKVKNVRMRPMTRGAKIVAENILFATGKATLRSESYQELDRLVKLLKENPSVKIEVAGHTDNTGSASLNKRLSKERALSVKRYLETKGIGSGRIEYEGYGPDEPIAPNNTSEGRAQNRRVEIEVIE